MPAVGTLLTRVIFANLGIIFLSNVKTIHDEQLYISLDPTGPIVPDGFEEPMIELAVFFNTFVRKDSKKHFKRRAVRIIKSQIEMIEESAPNATIYYSRFGDLNSTYPFPPCKNCVKLRAKARGDEVDTLQALHQYCVFNPSARVIYMHSKGTYTAHPENDLLRNILMKAISSKECQNMPRSSDHTKPETETCNVCSSQIGFIPPYISFIGNMWVAECEYVRKLIPPRDFEEAKSNLLRQVWKETDSGENTQFKGKKKMSWNQFRKPSWVGIERYAMEHWISSHPDYQPCEVFSLDRGYPKVEYRWGKKNEKPSDISSWFPVRQLAPGKDFKAYWSFYLHPWANLRGRLYEYEAMYSKIPSKTSWVYRFYPNK